MPKIMCGPAGTASMKKRPMCGPKPGSEVWKKQLVKDQRVNNLAKARAIKQAKKIDKSEEQDV